MTPLPGSLRMWDLDDLRWYGFVESQAEATAFHHPAWARLLAKTYGYRPLVLVCETAEGQVATGLPVVDVRSPLTGRRFHSLPFTDHCPPLARSDADRGRLIEALSLWRQAFGSTRLQINAALPPAPSWQSTQVGVRHILSLDGGRAGFLTKAKGQPVLRAIHKAEREGVHVSITRSPDALADFYGLACQTRRRLGVPVQPKRFFEGLWSDMLAIDLGFAVMAKVGSQPVAGGVFLSWKKTLIYKYSASDPRYWHLRPNNLVIWKALEWAFERGVTVLDFGRSGLGEEGLRTFKMRWGALEHPLLYSSLGGALTRRDTGLAARTLAAVIRRSPPLVCRGVGELLYGHMA